MDNLFAPLELGDIPLRNRIVMAPMTRSRATAEDDLVTICMLNITANVLVLV